MFALIKHKCLLGLTKVASKNNSIIFEIISNTLWLKEFKLGKKVAVLSVALNLTMADGDIDLYADVEGDFSAEDFHNESGDLYDDVLTNTKDDKSNIVKGENSSSTARSAVMGPPTSSHNVKRFQLYIGNLTW